MIRTDVSYSSTGHELTVLNYPSVASSFVFLFNQSNVKAKSADRSDRNIEDNYIPSRGEMIYRYDLLVLRRTGSRDTWLVEVLAPFLLGRGMSSMLSFAKDENVGKCRKEGWTSCCSMESLGDYIE